MNLNVLVLVLSLVVIAFVLNKQTSMEKFVPGSKGASVSYKMSPYDGKHLKNKEEPTWRNPPANEKLVSSNLYTPQGRPIPLASLETPISENSEGPFVEGVEGKPKSMFMFAYNKCHPGCCPSTYSCDHGCVCTTKNQRNFISRRGDNRA